MNHHITYADALRARSKCMHHQHEDDTTMTTRDNRLQTRTETIRITVAVPTGLSRSAGISWALANPASVKTWVDADGGIRSVAVTKDDERLIRNERARVRRAEKDSRS